MENASKALIIAGAILLSILIIGLGMFVFGQASHVMKKVNLDETQVQTINSKFTNYGTNGSRINGTQAKNLCETVMSYNRTTAEDSSQFVNFRVVKEETTAPTSNGATANQAANDYNKAIETAKGGLQLGHTYILHYTYDDDSNLIIDIRLEDTK